MSNCPTFTARSRPENAPVLNQGERTSFSSAAADMRGNIQQTRSTTSLTEELQSSNKPPITILDYHKKGILNLSKSSNFEKIDLDGDGKGDLTHGQVVEAIVRSTGTSTKASALNRGLNTQGAAVMNCSFGYFVSFQDLKTITGIDVNSNNVAEKRAEVLEGLTKACRGKNSSEIVPNTKTSKGTPLLYAELNAAIIRAKYYELCAKDGTTIVQGAGNDGPKYIAIESLAKDCITVGGLDTNGKPHPSSGNHSLIKKWEPFTIKIEGLRDGLDLNHDGKADIPWSQTSSKGKNFALQSQNVPTDIVNSISPTVDKMSLDLLAKRINSGTKLASGIYRATDLDISGMGEGALLKYTSGSHPKVEVIAANEAKRIPSNNIQSIDDATSTQLSAVFGKDDSNRSDKYRYQSFLKADDLGKILIQAGIKDGEYDLNNLCQNLRKHAGVRIASLDEILIVKDGKFRVITETRPTSISGTSFAAPVASAKINKEKLANR